MIELALIVAGCLGLLGATWLFPVLAGFVQIHGGSASKKPDAAAEPLKIRILIPAHNEAKILKDTLLSIGGAVKAFNELSPESDISIVVGADGCSDNTAAIARAEGAEVVEFERSQGKWRVLTSLVEKISPLSPHWIIFADAGVLWEGTLLVEANPSLQDLGVVGICPAYRNPGAGKLEALLWNFERHLKNLESSAGGPVSIHGATVLYRFPQIKEALSQLSDSAWLNDDVVIPLCLRAKNPSMRIVYSGNSGVSDNPLASRVSNEFTRRRRMVVGNIQWIRKLLPTVVRQNRVAAVLAMRRVFRLLWAYWGLMLAAAMMIVVLRPLQMTHYLSVIAGLALIFAAMAYRFVKPLRRLLDAAGASLLAPYFYFSTDEVKGALWK
jgi:cellulose synthase/poly-beta-1,6-N-acetylglucosamine synthase-like glycosyltransferase